MKKNLDATFKTLSGVDIKDEKGDLAVANHLIVNALLTAFPDEQNLPGEEKLKRYQLAVRVNEGGEQELTPEEIVLIKKLSGKAYGALIVGQLYELLNS